MEKLVRQITESVGRISWFKSRPKNWVLKCLSFLFALFLWYFVAGEDKVDVNISVPVEIVNLPHKLIISNQFKKQLDVLVSGQRSIIRSIAEQHVTRSIDLSKATPGKIVIKNTLDSIHLPRGISVLRVQPESLTLFLDQLIEKQLPIEPLLTGAPADGFQVVNVVVEPPTLQIHGPETLLAEEQSIKTVPMDLSTLTHDISLPASLQLKPALIELIGEQIVTVTFDIEEKRLKRKIYTIPLPETALLPDQAISPATLSIEALIPVSLVKKTKDLRTLFKAELEGGPFAAGDQATVSVLVAPEFEERGIVIETIAPAAVTIIRKNDILEPRTTKQKKK